MVILILLPSIGFGSNILLNMMINMDNIGSWVYLVPIIIIVYLIVWIWQIFDANSLANKYNEALRRTGQPPW